MSAGGRGGAAPAPSRAAAGRLLRWFDRHQRDLPWRRAPSAYRTLVSELMLQQTVVATVQPYFERFVRRFPDLRALAAAPEDDVLALWSGLGYYARARHLHAAAAAVVQRHGGELPDDEEGLRALPGVGEYTAAAVASIAFGRRTFALDGNGARVMARLHGVADPINRPQTRAGLRRLGQALVPAARAGDFNQAVMELGALVCVPRTPRCADCPLRADCAAHATGRATELPVKERRAPRRQDRIACALVLRRGKVLLVRRQAGELLAGTWALPSAPVTGGAGAEEAARAAARGGGIDAGRPVFRGSVRHVFTHRDLVADVYAVPEQRPAINASAGDASGGGGFCWADPASLGGLGISSFTRKTLRAGISQATKRDKADKRP